jgi:RNA polymerase sigma-70 factor (ECF subfamily)
VSDDLSSDENMARLMFAGNEGATRTLLARYRRPLYGFLFRLCGDTAEAEDLFQETFLRVLRSSARFDPRGRFKPWIFAIALNLARDRARRLAHPAAPRLHERSDLPEPADKTPYGTHENDRILKTDLQSALAELTESLRAVVLLRYFEGLDEREIAAAVGIPRGTVKSRLHRGIGLLRTHLKDK